MNNYITIFLLILLPLFSIGQIDSLSLPTADSTRAKGGKSNFKFTRGFIMGATMSLPEGGFPKKIKDYNATIYSSDSIQYGTNLKPSFWYSIGLQYVSTPFFANKLRMVTGLYYYKRGFTEQVKLNYTRTQEINDKSTFNENYAFHFFSLPLWLRYDITQKFFVEGGLNYDSYFIGKKRHVLKHTVGGADAYEKGFSERESTTFFFQKKYLKPKPLGISLGLGYQANDKVGFRLFAHQSGSLNIYGYKYSALTTSLQMAYNF